MLSALVPPPTPSLVDIQPKEESSRGKPQPCKGSSSSGKGNKNGGCGKTDGEGEWTGGAKRRVKQKASTSNVGTLEATQLPVRANKARKRGRGQVGGH